MADYTLNAEFSRSGNGTNLCPTHWVSALQDALPVYDHWRQFTIESMDGEGRLVRAGIGDTININYFDNINVPTSHLSEGTFTPRGTQASSQVAITVYEDGHKLDLSGFQNWLTPSDNTQKAIDSLAKNAVQRLDYIIGAAYVGASNYFAINGTGTFAENIDTGTEGTNAVLPAHVRMLRARLARLGVEPYNVGGQMLYGWTIPPGAMSELASQSEFFESAARLGNAGPYTTGLIGVYGGFAFYEEGGPNASTTYSSSVGTSCIHGLGACVGASTLNDPGLMWGYNDVGDDGGRNARVLYNFRNGYSLTMEGTTNARAWLVYHKM